MSDTLKPCPFCGSKARIYGNDGGNGEWIARCTKLMSCGSRGSAWLTEDEAGAAWNTRAPVVAQSATTEVALLLKENAQLRLELRNAAWAAAESERHACSIAVWMTLQDALEPGADDKGLTGWMREAEARVKGRS